MLLTKAVIATCLAQHTSILFCVCCAAGPYKYSKQKVQQMTEVQSVNPHCGVKPSQFEMWCSVNVKGQMLAASFFFAAAGTVKIFRSTIINRVQKGQAPICVGQCAHLVIAPTHQMKLWE